MIWMTAVTVASAQFRTDNGLLDDRNYAAYARAVDALGVTTLPITTSTSSTSSTSSTTVTTSTGTTTSPQIGPGTMGIVTISQLEVGELMNIHAPAQPPHFLETQVVYDPAHIALMNTVGFTITHGGLIANNPETVEEELVALLDEDGDDGVEDYLAAEMPIPNRTIPNGVMLGHPDLESVTPALNDDLTLHCFRLEQAGQTRGWVLREVRDLGDQGVRQVDHWFYLRSYNVVDAPGESVMAVADSANCDSIPMFVGAIKLQAPPGGWNGLDRYQPAQYSYVPLAELVP